DKETGLPVESATVFIISTFDLPVPGAFTTEDGYFSISTVPAGTHTLVVSKVSYIDTSTSLGVVAGERTEVNFYIKRIPVTTPGTGNVTGTIIKEGSPQTGGGQGIAGLSVGVVGLGASDITNGNGEFMLYGVDSGPQKLQISWNGQIVYEKNIQVPDGQTLDTGITYMKWP
ncbi:carboxypeptidase-like regulatory domain-containing protein, partial [bacterium]|nr:carboxypeptidase-like regulatory domain-containing protein [bacterium]MBU1025340.1 carboxypeptidase-like regulatory domain-containing protein [bacterium]